MARRRLHGQTQKRRQKRRTRMLKLSASAHRVEATRRPMAFEASPELEAHDLEFLEAMRDAGVRRLPGAGGLPVRQKAIERAHFSAEEQNARDFAAAMTELGVQPLAEQTWGPPPRSRQSAIRQGEPVVPAFPHRPPPGAMPPGATQGTRFVTAAADAALRAQALRQEPAGLSAKFEGAPAPSPMRGQRRSAAPAEEPDEELDLHGATQEQALRRVQDFLLKAHRLRLRAVLIITGRGLGSGTQGPVLRTAVTRWLERNGGPYIRAFHPAPSRHGGDGALWVEMR
jgi:DNA-nicking Smr family endonuclease